MTPWLFIAALYSLTTLQPVTISIYPQAAIAPAMFRITVLVPRHLENRQICYGVTGPEDKKSCFTLDGWNSRRTWTVFWPLRTPGEYVAEAELTRVTEGRTQTYVNTQPFRVIGMTY